MNSDPLSMRMNDGAAKSLMSSSSTATTSFAFHRLPTRMARQRWLCYSITFRSLSLRTSAVATNWKSMAHIWWGCSAR